MLKELVFTNSADSILYMESFNQDLAFTQLKQLYITRGFTLDNSTFEKNMGLLRPDGRYNQLADLLSDINSCSIKVVRFDGRDKTDLVLRNECGYKCMFIAMEQALSYVNSFNETRVELNGASVRNEVRLFDEKCLREAWNNACLHTKWSAMIPPLSIFSATNITK